MPVTQPIATIIYNNYQFDVAHRMRISGRIEYDDADRAMKWIVYTIDITGEVTLAGLGPNGQAQFTTTMDTVYQLLTEPGQELVIQSAGFKTFRVNALGVNDVQWGPKPRVLDWEPLEIGRAHV